MRFGAWGTLGALIVGAAGFLAGFIGPILITPGANQGPLLGIFLTGPLGAIIGFLVGLVVARYERLQAAWKLSVLCLSALVVALAVLAMVFTDKDTPGYQLSASHFRG